MGRGRGRRVARKLKLQITGGQANPAPPVGPALGQAQVNIGEFVRQFNDATREQMRVPGTVYRDAGVERATTGEHDVGLVECVALCESQLR